MGKPSGLILAKLTIRENLLKPFKPKDALGGEITNPAVDLSLQISSLDGFTSLQSSQDRLAKPSSCHSHRERRRALAGLGVDNLGPRLLDSLVKSLDLLLIQLLGRITTGLERHESALKWRESVVNRRSNGVQSAWGGLHCERTGMMVHPA